MRRHFRRLLFAVAVASLALVPHAGAATRVCNPAAQVPLDLAAAAATPMFGASKAAPLGLQRARTLIGGLAKGDPCGAKATPAVRVALAAVERAAAAHDLPRAKRLLGQVLVSIRARRVTAVSGASALARVAARPARHAKKCPIDRAPKVRPQDADKVGDYLEAAKTAQKIKDEAAATKAMDGARGAYGSWAGKQMAGGGARTVGDFVSIARGGQMLGNESVAAKAIDGARDAATKDVDRASEIDDCTATKDDVTCLASAIAVAQALGADIGDASARLTKVNNAVEARLLKKIPEGCEEWSFTMSLTTVDDEGNDWTMRWAPGRFRVSRANSTLDGSQLAGYGAGWPGIIGNSKGRCWEESDGGRIDHGPTTLTGGPFHYAIGGTVTDTGFSLELSSADAKAKIDGPSAEVCQLLAGLAQLVVDSFVKSPFPIEFEVAPGQTTVSYDQSEGNTSFKATITRVKG